MSKQSTFLTIELMKSIHENESPESTKRILLQQIYNIHKASSPENCVKKILLDGSNTFANIWRGWKGVDYDEIVEDVAKELKINKNLIKNKSFIEIEELILRDISEKYYNTLSEKEQDIIDNEAKHHDNLANFIFGQESTHKYDDLVKVIGYGVQRKCMPMIKNYFGNLINKLPANQVKQINNIKGPALIAIAIAFGAFAAYQISGPAYRKIVPSIILISQLRFQNI